VEYGELDHSADCFIASWMGPLMGDRPQEIINSQVLEDSDLLIAVFWTRLGTPTDEAGSGRVEEINKHLEAGKPALIYFSSTPVQLESVDEAQYRALKEFKEECKERGLIQTYDSPSEFRDKLYDHLSITINTHPYFLDVIEATGGKEPVGSPQKSNIPLRIMAKIVRLATGRLSPKGGQNQGKGG
jgi:hypothetical protein